MIDVKHLLDSTFSILLVDWPDTLLPRALLDYRFSVFGFSPKGFTRALLADEPPEDLEQCAVFPPTDKQRGFLIFRRIETAPLHVDLVHVFRPPEELETIITTVVAQLGAETIWLQPPITSVAARQLAERKNVAFVEGVDIIDAIRQTGVTRSAATQ